VWTSFGLVKVLIERMSKLWVEHPGYYDLKQSEKWYNGVVKEYEPNE
jgi:hypothetical protein